MPLAAGMPGAITIVDMFVQHASPANWTAATLLGCNLRPKQRLASQGLCAHFVQVFTALSVTMCAAVSTNKHRVPHTKRLKECHRHQVPCRDGHGLTQQGPACGA